MLPQVSGGSNVYCVFDVEGHAMSHHQHVQGCSDLEQGWSEAPAPVASHHHKCSDPKASKVGHARAVQGVQLVVSEPGWVSQISHSVSYPCLRRILICNLCHTHSAWVRVRCLLSGLRRIAVVAINYAGVLELVTMVLGAPPGVQWRTKSPDSPTSPAADKCRGSTWAAQELCATSLWQRF